jgi:hypothetical protein
MFASKPAAFNPVLMRKAIGPARPDPAKPIAAPNPELQKSYEHPLPEWHRIPPEHARWQ